MSARTTKAISREAAAGLAELRRVRGEIEAVAEGLDEAAFMRQPTEGRWSVGECIGHLTATGRVYLRKMPGAIAAARKEGLTGEGPVRRGWLVRVFIWALEPPARIKVKAPTAFLPRPGLSKAETMGEFRASRDALDKLMDASGDLDWGRVRMALPTIPAVKLRLGEIYAFLLAHERRHLWQMQRVRDAIDPRLSRGGQA